MSIFKLREVAFFFYLTEGLDDIEDSDSPHVFGM